MVCFFKVSCGPSLYWTDTLASSIMQIAFWNSKTESHTRIVYWRPTPFISSHALLLRQLQPINFPRTLSFRFCRQETLQLGCQWLIMQKFNKSQSSHCISTITFCQRVVFPFMSIIHKDGIYCPMILVETKCSQQRKILHILQNHSPHISGHLSVARSESCASILSRTSLLWLLMAESSHRPVQPYSLSCNVKDLHQYLTSLAMKCLTSLDMIIFTAIKLKQSRIWKASIENLCSWFLLP